MGWICLIAAILLEVFGTTMMKISNGLTQLMPTITMFVCYMLCFGFLAVALKTIPMSVAYAIWSAIGVIAISTIGILFFHEDLNWIKVVSTLLIIIGVIGLKLSST